MANAEAAPRLVELRDVRKSFGDNVVLDEIDLAISSGEAIVIAGPSGSGKSTMLRCINGLEEVDSGEVLLPASASTRGRSRSAACVPTSAWSFSSSTSSRRASCSRRSR